MILDHHVGSWAFPLPLYFALLVTPARAQFQHKQLREAYSWSSLDFDFSSTEERDAAIYMKSFIPGQILPMDVDLHENDRGTTVFVTVPRFQLGVPVTLGYLTVKINDEGNRLIAPYPTWLMQNQGPACLGMVNVYRIAIDSADRLWALDSGKIINDQICPPKLIVFSLKTNEPLKRYEFPKNQYSGISEFITFVVDERDSSKNVFLYIADPDGFGLIVYDEENDRSWRIVDNLVYPYPNHGTFNIDNVSFDYMNGIFSLGLGPVLPDGDRILFFHALSSVVESYVQTSIIRNFTLFNGQQQAPPRSFRSLRGPRSSQSASEAMDSNGVLFYSLLSDAAIGCWNTNRPDEFGGPIFDTIVTNKETLQFPCAMKIKKRKGTNIEDLWVVSNRFQIMASGGTFNPNEINFRIQVARIDDLVEGTRCQSSSANFCSANDYG